MNVVRCSQQAGFSGRTMEGVLVPWRQRRTGSRAAATKIQAISDVRIEVEKTSWSSRRIYAAVVVAAPKSCVWSALTDYDNLGNFVPSLVENRCLERTANSAVVYQAFRGIWRLQQTGELSTLLSYALFVKPQAWLPVALIQGRIENEVVRNLEVKGNINRYTTLYSYTVNGRLDFRRQVKTYAVHCTALLVNCLTPPRCAAMFIADAANIRYRQGNFLPQITNPRYKYLDQRLNEMKR
ncbi:hypothetical protein VOLCADRAFT_100126 [Volvox carteri f. nagariensis]|uniref:Coenzyme Q-binding protein COQ10 START domain-containing protein n=1 Tax=Volvox carteri f. nagariensis TaxID=3068 RepID=D8UJH1_VOLCA|nr:uncharacterized protein VOLCADRAFT_100126 [Volvox carteri f. nagariensis]EFJ40109.1 hypothetical protein VOLCADRAFT_100126 [Volvox carteri f. nagariensis]|eukprot:XP_002958805.1 hypothetical protein VOLCADRAFT_100126 [Volvox carteri f. nagariensis]